MADSKGDNSTKTALLLDDFVTSLRRRKVEGSLDTAKRTALLMRHVIADARTPNPADLIAAVRAAGMRLVEACRTGASRLPRSRVRSGGQRGAAGCARALDAPRTRPAVGRWRSCRQPRSRQRHRVFGAEA